MMASSKVIASLLKRVEAAVSLQDVLADPAGRRQVEGIDDLLSSLADKNGNDKTLEDALKGAVEALKKSHGYEYKV